MVKFTYRAERALYSNNCILIKMIVISPAKRLSFSNCDIILNATTPAFDEEANLLAKQLEKLNVSDLANLMGVSDELQNVFVERFKSWGKQKKEEKRAIFQFEGDVFKHLDAIFLDNDDIAYMNQRLTILSVLYGLLRPSDR